MYIQYQFSLSLFFFFLSFQVLTGRGFKLRQDSRSLRPNCTKKVSAVSNQGENWTHTFESLLAELEVQCEPVEDEVAEEVVEIEDLQ